MITKTLLTLVCCGFAAYPIGQSATMTLAFPTGARSNAMGEVGTALADDEDVGFYNPAGLGMFNGRWKRGAVTEFYEPIWPIFEMPELWHHNLALVYQPNSATIGGFALYWNYINFGENEWTNETGSAIGSARSFEQVFNVSWGFNFEEIGLRNHYFGLSAKYIYSALAPSFGAGDEGAGQTVAFDIGYLWQFLPRLRLGLTLQNMGPNISNQQYPLPFTINLALAYSQDFFVDKSHFGQIRTEVRADREVVKNYLDKKPDPFWVAIYTDLLHDTSSDVSAQQKLDEINWHLGVEYTAFNTVSLREGYLLDRARARFEHHYGMGVRLFNHFQFDWADIFAPESYLGWLFGHDGANGARHGQWGISFTFIRIFDWSDADRTWWRQ